MFLMFSLRMQVHKNIKTPCERDRISSLDQCNHYYALSQTYYSIIKPIMITETSEKVCVVEFLSVARELLIRPRASLALWRDK